MTRGDEPRPVIALGVCRFSKKFDIVTTGDMAAPFTKDGNWKWVPLKPGVPRGWGLRVATGLKELQKCTGIMGVL